jgi:glycosyltransferase involved in cell wall biosynthesis
MRILWIAPNLNHYKNRFLEQFVNQTGADVTILAGTLQASHGNLQEKERLPTVTVKATKRKFQYSREVYKKLNENLKLGNYQIVIMPPELKHILLVIYIKLLSKRFRFKIVAYSHSLLLSRAHSAFRKPITKFVFGLYDRVIFYTEAAKQSAIAENLIDPKKAGYANNTIDTSTIWGITQFSVKKTRPKRLLFIGRLKSDKWLPELFEHFIALTQSDPTMELVIIGDGPERSWVKKKVAEIPGIAWLGGVIDEVKICEIMKSIDLTFVPGHSGLSIPHSFAYGKPYITMKTYENHPPEFSYLIDGVNGLILGEDTESNCERIRNLLFDDELYAQFCQRALDTAKSLSVKNWCIQVNQNLKQLLGDQRQQLI